MPPRQGSENFYKNYEPEPNTGCWLWTKPLGAHGYGRYTTETKTWLAHRYSYALSNGSLKDSDCVLHKCDTRPCVNPSHLFIGSRADNIRDCVKKKRNSVGEHRWNSKLKNEDILEIRRINEVGGMFHREIAKKFNVCSTTITLIVNKKIWKHI